MCDCLMILSNIDKLNMDAEMVDAIGENSGGISVGKEFSSYAHLFYAIKEHEAANSVTLYTRSSRTVQAARKHAPQPPFFR